LTERFDAGGKGGEATEDAVRPDSNRSSIDSAEVRLQLAEAGHITVSDGSGRAPFPCDVGPHLRRSLQDREDHSNLSSMKHSYKLPVVPNVKHNVTEKVAQVRAIVESRSFWCRTLSILARAVTFTFYTGLFASLRNEVKMFCSSAIYSELKGRRPRIHDH